jgi:hypothetical protein
MKRLTTACAVLALGGCVLPMGMPGLGGAGGIGTNPEEARQMSASMQAAQASAAAQASRPGDADMNCAAIQAELMAQKQDPKFQAAMASMGARAKDQKAKQDAAMAGGKQTTPTAADARAPLDTGADLVTMMPQIMRGQRLNELATAKQCSFLKPPA